MKIGFIGLGHMGSPMARRLVDAGHDLVVYNRTRAKAEELRGPKVKVAHAPAAAAREAEVLVTMLSDDVAVEETLYGPDGASPALERGAVHVSMSTISPSFSRRLARLADAAGQAYVAAPVLGRPDAAARGELVVIAAGPDDAIVKARPVLDAIGKQTRVVGEEAEKANVVKLAVNFVLASMIEVLGEAYALAESEGIDDATLLAILNDCLLQSPVVGAYGKKIAEDAFEPAGFKLALGAKDVRLAVEAGERAAVPMPVGSTLRDRFVAAIADGLGEEDWSAIGRVSTRRFAAPRQG